MSYGIKYSGQYCIYKLRVLQGDSSQLLSKVCKRYSITTHKETIHEYKGRMYVIFEGTINKNNLEQFKQKRV